MSICCYVISYNLLIIKVYCHKICKIVFFFSLLLFFDRDATFTVYNKKNHLHYKDIKFLDNIMLHESTFSSWNNFDYEIK